MTQVISLIAIHLGFWGFTFSINQTRLLTHHTSWYGHIEQQYKQLSKLNFPLTSYSKKSLFKILLLVVVVVPVQEQLLKNQKRYEVETLHHDRNPCTGVHASFHLFVNKFVYK